MEGKLLRILSPLRLPISPSRLTAIAYSNKVKPTRNMVPERVGFLLWSSSIASSQRKASQSPRLHSRTGRSAQTLIVWCLLHTAEADILALEPILG